MQNVNALRVTSDLCMLHWRQLVIVPEGAVGPTPVAMGQPQYTIDFSTGNGSYSAATLHTRKLISYYSIGL